MNILYLTNHLNIGGITSYVLTLARGLGERGHNIYLACGRGQLLPRFKAEGIIYLPVPLETKSELSPKILVSMFKLSPQIKRYDINLIHTHSRTTQVLGSLLSRYTGVAHVSTCHGFFKKRPLRRLFPCWGKKVIAISASVKEHLIQDFRVREKNIAVIHNGIDINRFRVQSTEYRVQRKKALGLTEGPVVGIVARLADVKGHSYLIAAMQKVLEKIPQAQLLIVGEGRQKKALVELIRTLGIEKNVFLIPSVSDTREVLSVMDVFVLPSLKEGLGLALMEAMAAGLAVIGSDIGGIRSLIQNGENGLLVKPGDKHALGAAILDLLRDAPKRDLLSKRAQVFIQKNFSQEKMVLETERVYLECLKH